MQPLMISRDRDQLGLDGGPVTARPLDLAPLVGTWVNVDGHAAGIARMEIADRGGLLAVRVFGVLAVGAEQVDWGSGGLKSKASTQASGDQAEPSGSPPVDWGEVVGEAFSEGVTSRAAVGFVAHYDFESQKVLVDAHINQRLLVVEVSSTFTGSSRRPGYLRRQLLVHSLNEAA